MQYKASFTTAELFIITADTFFEKELFNLIVGIYYPPGELISLQQHRCSPFAVVYYSFMGHCLAAAAISTRE